MEFIAMFDLIWSNSTMLKHDPWVNIEVNISFAPAVTLAIGSVERPLLVSDGLTANEEDRVWCKAWVDEVG